MEIETSLVSFKYNLLNYNSDIKLVIVEPGYYYYDLPKKVIRITINSLIEYGLSFEDIIISIDEDSVTFLIDKMNVPFTVIISCEGIILDKFEVKCY